MLTTRARHALKLLAALARRGGKVPLNKSELSAASGVPSLLINGILVQLRNRDLVRSTAGRDGGHCLARPPEEISVLAVVRAIDGPVAPLLCLSETKYQRCADCPGESTCEVRRLMLGVNEVFLQTMAKTSLANVGQKPEPTRASLGKRSRTPTSLIGVCTPLGKSSRDP